MQDPIMKFFIANFTAIAILQALTLIIVCCILFMLVILYFNKREKKNAK